MDLIIFIDPNFWSTGYGLGSTPQVIGGYQQQYQNKIFTSSSHLMRKGLGRSGKHEKQAGTGAGSLAKPDPTDTGWGGVGDKRQNKGAGLGLSSAWQKIEEKRK